MPKPPRTRKRNLDIVQMTRPMEYESSKGKWVPHPAYPGGPVTVFKGKQVTVSEGHAISPDGEYHEGGPFYTAKLKGDIPWAYATLEKEGLRCIGPVFTDPGVPPGLKLRDEDTSDLDTYGTTAIAQVAPTNPEAALATATGELLRDGLPSIPGLHLWKQKAELARSVGSEFLNTVFGWAPLINDVDKLASAARDHKLILDQYKRDKGKLVRRRFDFPIERSESETEIPNTYARHWGGRTGMFVDKSQYATLTRREVTTTRRWFSGGFTYGAGSDFDSVTKALGYGSEAEKLLGITITPEVLWELAPWSWAVDWVTNAGDVVSNFSQLASAGLVMRYGYIMEEKSTIVTSSLSKSGLLGQPKLKVPPSRWELTSKVRREANPFGFGVTWDGLSPLQLAISAALGFTHLR